MSDHGPMSKTEGGGGGEVVVEMAWSAMVTEGTAGALALQLLGDRAVLSQSVFLLGKSWGLFP